MAIPRVGKGEVPNSKYQVMVSQVWLMKRSVTEPVGVSLDSCCRSSVREWVIVVLSCEVLV